MPTANSGSPSPPGLFARPPLPPPQCGQEGTAGTLAEPALRSLRRVLSFVVGVRISRDVTAPLGEGTVALSLVLLEGRSVCAGVASSFQLRGELSPVPLGPPSLSLVVFR